MASKEQALATIVALIEELDSVDSQDQAISRSKEVPVVASLHRAADFQGVEANLRGPSPSSFLCVICLIFCLFQFKDVKQEALNVRDHWEPPSHGVAAADRWNDKPATRHSKTCCMEWFSVAVFAPQLSTKLS